MENFRERFILLVKRLKFSSVPSSEPRGRPKLIILLVSAVVIFVLAKFSYGYLNQPLPTITLYTPEENGAVLSDDLYVRGKVTPLGSKVLINGQTVALNGDGTFTAILKIQEGKNTLQVTAEKVGKRAEVIRLVQRNLSPEETRLRSEAKAKEEAEARAKAASQDKEIAQVQAAYTQREVKRVRVIEHKVEEDSGLKRVTGKVANDTDEPVYWVKVTATFLDRQEGTIGTKIAFVTSFDKFLKPGETAPFAIQSIEAQFDHYQLEVTWEKE